MTYLPEVAWSTMASNVSLGATTYRYYITVNPLDPNEPGASPITVAINDWFSSPRTSASDSAYNTLISKSVNILLNT